MAGRALSSKASPQLAELRIRLAEAEDTLNAIRSGTVDALVVHTPRGEQVFTLEGADQTYRALVEAMSEGALTLTKGLISYCNQHFAKIVRAPMEDVFGTSIFEFVQSDNFRRLIRQLEKGPDSRRSIETILRAADGARIPVLLSGSRFYSEDRVAVGLVVTDITERKEVERARQELSRNILAAQERERQRVARDLHDSVSQLLASANYRLRSIATQAGKAGHNAGILQVLGLVEKAIGEVRLISRNLRPSELDDLGLPAALRALTHDFKRRNGIEARFKNRRGTTPARLSKEAEMTLYRIVQESLNNVEKHSGARKVELVLNASPSNISLTVRDDGRGIAPNRKNGSGLQNMSERAAMLGGQLDVRSIPGRGTKITVSIPLAKENG